MPKASKMKYTPKSSGSPEVREIYALQSGASELLETVRINRDLYYCPY